MLREGREAELAAMAQDHASEDRAALPVLPDLEAFHPSALFAEIGAYLAETRLARPGKRSQDEQDAIDIYGFFLAKNATGADLWAAVWLLHPFRQRRAPPPDLLPLPASVEGLQLVRDRRDLPCHP